MRSKRHKIWNDKLPSESLSKQHNITLYTPAKSKKRLLVLWQCTVKKPTWVAITCYLIRTFRPLKPHAYKNKSLLLFQFATIFKISFNSFVPFTFIPFYLKLSFEVLTVKLYCKILSTCLQVTPQFAKLQNLKHPIPRIKPSEVYLTQSLSKKVLISELDQTWEVQGCFLSLHYFTRNWGGNAANRPNWDVIPL